MTDIWRLKVDVPDHDLVQRKGRAIRRTLGIPAIHNLRGALAGHAAGKAHKAALFTGLRSSPSLHGAAVHLRNQVWDGHPYDVLLIRRAPRPLDCAIQDGEWKRGGRQLYGDNAESAMKPSRDWLYKVVFGLDDDSSPLLRWHVGQERSGAPKLYQIEVIITPALGEWYELPDAWLKGRL